MICLFAWIFIYLTGTKKCFFSVFADQLNCIWYNCILEFDRWNSPKNRSNKKIMRLIMNKMKVRGIKLHYITLTNLVVEGSTPIVSVLTYSCVRCVWPVYSSCVLSSTARGRWSRWGQVAATWEEERTHAQCLSSQWERGITLAAQNTWHKPFDMEVAALLALTLLLGALIILVALAVGRRKEEIREETEQAAEFASKSYMLANLTLASHWSGDCVEGGESAALSPLPGHWQAVSALIHN